MQWKGWRNGMSIALVPLYVEDNSNENEHCLLAYKRDRQARN